MSLVVCRGGGVTKRHYYVSSCLKGVSQGDTIMSLVVCRGVTSDTIMSL